jgi:16S rRNA (guanine966-N2)-methyltransferase
LRCSSTTAPRRARCCAPTSRPWRSAAQRASGAPFALAFLDPPYDKGLAGPALAALCAGNWLAEGALVVVEEAAKAGIAAPPALDLVDERVYGETRIVFFAVARPP